MGKGENVPFTREDREELDRINNSLSIKQLSIVYALALVNLPVKYFRKNSRLFLTYLLMSYKVSNFMTNSQLLWVKYTFFVHFVRRFYYTTCVRKSLLLINARKVHRWLRYISVCTGMVIGKPVRIRYSHLYCDADEETNGPLAFHMLRRCFGGWSKVRRPAAYLANLFRDEEKAYLTMEYVYL